MKINEELMRATVEAGVVLLDRENPGWHNEIDVENLYLADCKRCVLGQLYGMFGAGLRTLKLSMGAPYGFAINSIYLDKSAREMWKSLTKIWIEEIEARLLRDELNAAMDIGVPVEEGVRVGAGSS